MLCLHLLKRPFPTGLFSSEADGTVVKSSKLMIIRLISSTSLLIGAITSEHRNFEPAHKTRKFNIKEVNVEFNIELNVELNVEFNIELNIELNVEFNVEFNVELNVEFNVVFFVEVLICLCCKHCYYSVLFANEMAHVPRLRLI